MTNKSNWTRLIDQQKTYFLQISAKNSLKLTNFLSQNMILFVKVSGNMTQVGHKWLYSALSNNHCFESYLIGGQFWKNAELYITTVFTYILIQFSETFLAPELWPKRPLDVTRGQKCQEKRCLSPDFFISKSLDYW